MEGTKPSLNESVAMGIDSLRYQNVFEGVAFLADFQLAVSHAPLKIVVQVYK